MLNISKEQINRFVEKMIQEEKENELFLEETRDTIINNIYNYLKDNIIIDNEDMLYFPSNYSFKEKEYCLLFIDIMDYAIERKLSYVEKESFFENNNCNIKYKDLIITLRMAHGQGTMMQMRTDIKKLKKDKLFTYEQYKDNKR